MRVLPTTLAAAIFMMSVPVGPALSSEEDDRLAEAEAYAVSSYAALYNLSAERLKDQMERNIIHFGNPSAYVGYLQALKDSNLAQRIQADKADLVTEITDIETAPSPEGAFLVRLGVRQTITSKAYEMTTCFDAIASVAENKVLNLGSSPFTNIGQPVAMGSRQCAE